MICAQFLFLKKYGFSTEFFPHRGPLQMRENVELKFGKIRCFSGKFFRFDLLRKISTNDKPRPGLNGLFELSRCI
jgi:hypothetical protein